MIVAVRVGRLRSLGAYLTCALMGESLPRLPFPSITSISHLGQFGLGDLTTRGDKPGYQNVLPFIDLGD